MDVKNRGKNYFPSFYLKYLDVIHLSWNLVRMFLPIKFSKYKKEISKNWQKIINVRTFLSKSGNIGIFCISRKHFWNCLFVSCRFLIWLENKTASNTKFCKIFLKWHIKFDRKLKKIKQKTKKNKKIVKTFFFLFRWSNCFSFFREEELYYPECKFIVQSRTKKISITLNRVPKWIKKIDLWLE